MKYSITIEIGKDRFGYDTVRSEASLDAENLPAEAMEQIVRAMILDAEKKANRKFSDKTTAEAEPPTAPVPEGEVL